MANSHCGGEHTPGEAFPETGNVYCRKCGEFLWTDPLPYAGPFDVIDPIEGDRYPYGDEAV